MRRHRPINQCGPPPGYFAAEVDGAARLNVAEWMDREALKPRKVWVEAPRKVNNNPFSKNFVTYTVLVTVGDADAVAVRRRFSDFEKLHKSFALRFGATGMLVPTLPPKRGWGTNPELVAERVCALTLFADAVDRNAFLANDALWLHFLTPGGDMDRPDETPAASVGETRWTEAREQLYAVGRDRMRDDATLHVALGMLETSDAEIRALQTGCEALAKAMEHFAEGAQCLFAAETSWIDVAAHDERFAHLDDDERSPELREPASLPSGLVPAGVAAAATGLAEHKEAVTRLPLEINAMSREATDYQLSQAREFRALAATYKKMDTDALAALRTNTEDRSSLNGRETELRAYGGALVGFSLRVLANERRHTVASLTRELSPSLVAHAKDAELFRAKLENRTAATALQPPIRTPAAVTPAPRKASPNTSDNGPEASPTVSSFTVDCHAQKTFPGEVAPVPPSPEGLVA